MVQKRIEILIKGLPGAINQLIANFIQFQSNLINQVPSGISIISVYLEGNNKIVIIAEDSSSEAEVAAAIAPIIIFIGVIIAILIALGIIAYNIRVYNIDTQKLQLAYLTCQDMIEAGLTNDQAFKDLCVKTFQPSPPVLGGLNLEQIAGIGLIAIGGLVALQYIQTLRK